MRDSEKSPEPGYDIARLLMLFDQYEQVCRTIGDAATVVPIKGIALIRDLYADTLDRHVSDIDLVVVPGSALPEVTRRLLDTGLYHLEFEYLSDPAAILAKKKVSLISNSPRLTDLDLHGDFSTKKYFRLSCPDFSNDVVSRLHHDATGNTARMDSVDEWLFLAAHGCFHMFSDNKWIRDLYLLQNRFSDAELRELQSRISRYGFDRIAWQAYSRFKPITDSSIRMAEPLKGSDRRFKRFIMNFHSRPRKGLGNRLTKLYYEFIHITDPTKRKQTYRRLLFPSLSMLSGIYRTRSATNLLLYPLHILLTLLTLTSFHIYYLHLSHPRN